MPKGVYRRDGEFCGNWTDEMDAWLKLACSSGASYGAIARAFCEAFPNDRKSRSAILGRASRRGYAKNKPPAPGRWGKPVEVKNRVDRKVRRDVTKKLAPVVFKQQESNPLGLRSDAEPRINKHGRTSKSAKTPEQIEEAKKGHVPCVVEEKPLTSISIDDCPVDGCKWPTNDDMRCFEVCGEKAVIGAYCERHGRVAYREMPTVKRNREYARRGTFEAERKRIADADAQWIADNVLDDEVQAPGLAPEVEGLLSQFLGGLE